MGEMTGGLPPGPWRAARDGGGPIFKFVDRDGRSVLESDWDDWHGTFLQASPEIFRAIEALPTLVAAVRATIEDLGGPAESPRYRSAFRLRQALALVDGGDAWAPGG